MAAPSAPTKLIRTGHDASSMKLTDDTPTTPLELPVKFDNHNFQLTNMVPDGRETVVMQARGKLRSIREGNLVFPKLSFSADVTELSESSAGTLLDWIYKRAPFAARVSTLLTHSTKDHSDFTFTMERGATDEIIVCEDIYFESWSFGEGDEGNKLTFEATVYGNVTLDGAIIFTAPRA